MPLGWLTCIPLYTCSACACTCTCTHVYMFTCTMHKYCIIVHCLHVHVQVLCNKISDYRSAPGFDTALHTVRYSIQFAPQPSLGKNTGKPPSIHNINTARKGLNKLLKISFSYLFILFFFFSKTLANFNRLFLIKMYFLKTRGFKSTFVTEHKIATLYVHCLLRHVQTYCEGFS